MSDWPKISDHYMPGACITTSSPHCTTYNTGPNDNAAILAAPWPATSVALAVPFTITQPTTAKQMFWENGSTSGVTDIGIYDRSLNLLVNLGPTSNTGSAAAQIGNITDTNLVPGSYYMAMLSSTITTQTYASWVTTALEMRTCGLVEQAVGGTTLPNPLVAAVYTRAYLPFMGISFGSVM
jgi:hypothetical protein